MFCLCFSVSSQTCDWPHKADCSGSDDHLQETGGSKSGHEQAPHGGGEHGSEDHGSSHSSPEESGHSESEHSGSSGSSSSGHSNGGHSASASISKHDLSGGEAIWALFLRLLGNYFLTRTSILNVCCTAELSKIAYMYLTICLAINSVLVHSIICLNVKKKNNLESSVLMCCALTCCVL